MEVESPDEVDQLLARVSILPIRSMNLFFLHSLSLTFLRHASHPSTHTDRFSSRMLSVRQILHPPPSPFPLNSSIPRLSSLRTSLYSDVAAPEPLRTRLGTAKISPAHEGCDAVTADEGQPNVSMAGSGDSGPTFVVGDSRAWRRSRCAMFPVSPHVSCVKGGGSFRSLESAYCSKFLCTFNLLQGTP